MSINFEQDINEKTSDMIDKLFSVTVSQRGIL